MAGAARSLEAWRVDEAWRVEETSRTEETSGSRAGRLGITFAMLLGSLFLVSPSLFGIEAQDEGPVVSVLLANRPKSLFLESRHGFVIEVDTEAPQGFATSDLAPLESESEFSVRFAGPEVEVAGKSASAASFRVRGRESFPVTITVDDSESVTVEGWLEVYWFDPPRAKSGVWMVLNRLPVERYLLGVLPGEMPTRFPRAALEAQAVAARTYALYHMIVKADWPYHVRNTVASQVYVGVNDDDRVRAAVERTRGQILVHEGQIFETYFHSTCGGHTQSAAERFGAPDITPLRAVRCPHCKGSDWYEWEREVPVTQLERALRRVTERHGVAMGRLQGLETERRRASEHLDYVRVVHSAGSFDLRSDVFRGAVGSMALPSTRFTCDRRGSAMRFNGRGFGHGVGLCQYGARAMADDGCSYPTILNFYYAGSELYRAWDFR